MTLAPEGPQRQALDPDIASALQAEPEAAAFFDGLAQFYRKGFLTWIAATKKKPDERARRIAETVRLLKAGIKERPEMKRGWQPPSGLRQRRLQHHFNEQFGRQDHGIPLSRPLRPENLDDHHGHDDLRRRQGRFGHRRHRARRRGALHRSLHRCRRQPDRYRQCLFRRRVGRDHRRRARRQAQGRRADFIEGPLPDGPGPQRPGVVALPSHARLRAQPEAAEDRRHRHLLSA